MRHALFLSLLAVLCACATPESSQRAWDNLRSSQPTPNGGR